MLVTLLGIVIFIRFLHPLKTWLPILVTPLEIVTLVKSEHPIKV